MRKALLTDPEHLKRRLEDLKRVPPQEQNIQHFEARAEACFRIALHPGTPAEEVLDNLAQAYRIDASNPKYAYHFARFYFIHGDIGQAAAWIKKALLCCPTSHRIWVHICLLQQFINDEKYKGREEYVPDDLRSRAEKILKGVAEGNSNIDPDLVVFEPRRAAENNAGSDVIDGDNKAETEPHPLALTKEENTILKEAKRSDRAGQCRWPGIIDLQVEDGLRGEPSKLMRDEMLPLLRQIVDDGSRRPGNHTAVAFILLEWLISGYAPATVRRLLAGVETTMPAGLVGLLDTVCSLYEADLTELPELLAEALRKKKIPHLVTAVIHKRRVLWRPIQFNALTIFRFAQQLIAEDTLESIEGEAQRGEEEKISKYSKLLLEAVRKLRAYAPEMIPDVETDHADAAFHIEDGQALVQSLFEIADPLEAIKNNAFTFLKKKLEPAVKASDSDEAFSQCACDYEEFKKFVSEFEATCATAYRKLTILSRAIQSAQTAEGSSEFLVQIEKGKKVYDKLVTIGNFIKVLRRIGKKIDRLATTFNKQQVPPSDDLNRLLEAMDAYKTPHHSGDAPPAENDDDTSPVENDQLETFESGKAGLVQIIDLADRDIKSTIEQALDTFSFYTEQDRGHPVIKTLECYVLSEASELLYRLGQLSRANRLWREILRLDPLNLIASHNLAVSETNHAHDHAAVLLAWKAHCEILYFHAIAMHDPKHLIEQRTEFHRNFASAYTTGFDLETDEKRQKDSTKFLFAFIQSGGSLREFIEHKLMEFFNRRLNYTSPTLVLGVSRSAAIVKRKQAHQRMLIYCEEMCSLLPKRVAGSFLSLCREQMDKALEACKDPEGLVLAKLASYQAEEAELLHWIKDVYRIKKRFLLAFREKSQKDPDWLKKIRHIDFIFLLDLLNKIPVEVSAEYHEGAVNSMRLGDASLVIDLLDGCSDDVVVALLPLVLQENYFDFDKRMHLFGEFARSFDSNRLFWRHFFNRQQLHRSQDDIEINSQKKKYAEVVRGYIRSVDDAAAFYPDFVKEALTGDSEPDKGVDFLKIWCSEFPALTGPSQHLCILLSKQGKPDEAIAYLEKAISQGIWPEGVEKCRQALAHIKTPGTVKKYIAQKKYQDALKYIRTQFVHEAYAIPIINALIDVYSDWVKNDAKGLSTKISDIEKDFNDCLALFKDKIDEKTRHTATANKRVILTQASIAHLGKLDAPEKISASIEAMQRLVTEDAGNYQAKVFLLQGLVQNAVQLAGQQEYEKAQQDLEAAASIAEDIITQSDNTDYIKIARDVSAQIEKINRKLGWTD